jgi:mitogen-activated protein kinase kinase kinase
MVHIKGQRSWSDRWASEKSSTPTLSLEDVKRKLVKFILSEDETSRTIDVEACQNGFEVLEKALRKFGKWRGIARGGPAGLGESESDTDEQSCLDVDGWGVYLHKGEDGESPTSWLDLVCVCDADTVDFPAQPLTEAELLAVCYAPPTDPARENGLYLRQMRILANRKDIGAIFGDVPPAVSLSPTSPNYAMATVRDRDSPRTANSLRNTHQTHRASMVSVMSALGVPSNDNLPKPQAPLPKSPSSGSFLANRGRKIHNFFGHRPPSEIISNHLYDYFPAAKRKDLEKTARNSMLRLGGKGDLDLGADSSRLSLDNNRLPSRFSVASSNSSHRMSRASSHKNISTPPSAAIPEEGRDSLPVPRVSISGDDGSELGPTFEEDEGVSGSRSEAPLLPPFEQSDESLSDSMPSFVSDSRPGTGHQDRRNSVRSTKSRRLSTISSRRKSRRISDAASLLTVDEITAKVENRRASVITFTESEEEAEDATDHFLAPGAIRLSRAYSPGLVPQEEGEVSDLEDSFEEEDEEEETDSEEEESEEEDEEEEQEENDNHGKAVTSTGGAPARAEASHRCAWVLTFVSSSQSIYQMDQRCTHRSRSLWQGLPRYGLSERASDGG